LDRPLFLITQTQSPAYDVGSGKSCRYDFIKSFLVAGFGVGVVAVRVEGMTNSRFLPDGDMDGTLA
jgi:hypothetical protein